ncbi:MAG: ISKra4 family transposase [Isosphaeraceae bacterium]
MEYRPKTVESLVGTIPLERAYYHCAHSGRSTIPWDQTLGLNRTAWTPGARDVVCLAGAVDSFAEAGTVVLRKRAGLHVSESTGARAGEATGQEIGRRLAAGEVFGPQTPWSWHQDAEGRTCAYVSIDLTGIGMQGPKAVAAEGRMAGIGMVYNPVPDERCRWAHPNGATPRFQARYVATLGGQAALSEPLRKQAAQVGMDRAERWIALCDAGAGLEDLLTIHFGRVEVVIVDFCHPAEHLGDLGRALFPSQEEQRADWIERWCSRLKHHGGQVVLEELRALKLDGRETVRQVYGDVVRYFEHQVHRMDYPTYQAKGWAIGSGPVESACKTVVGQRMKGGGMRWGGEGADAMCHLRALFKSGDRHWDAYWHPSAN